MGHLTFQNHESFDISYLLEMALKLLQKKNSFRHFFSLSGSEGPVKELHCGNYFY